MFTSRPERGLEAVSRIAAGDTEKITEDVRKYAEEHGYSESEVLEKGMTEMSEAFKDKGSDVYQQA